MALLRRRVRSSGGQAGPGASVDPPQPAAVAAARVSRASLLLGGLGILSALFVLARLAESWHVTPHAASHRIVILGQRLSYPTANAGAIVMIVLAALGLIVTVSVVRGTVRELVGARRMAQRLARLNPRPLRGALVIDDDRPQAFCAGLFRPRVYVSTGTVAMLDESGLDAVLAHERHHARRRDPLRLAAGHVLSRALFLLPGLGELVSRQRELAELSADESAVNAAPAHRASLAGAMLSFSDAAVPGGPAGIAPARVDYLLGESPSWRFPLALFLAAACVIALLLAVAVLIGQAAYGTATFAPPFLSRQPCVVVLAGIPAALGLAAAVFGRRVRSRVASRSAWPPPLPD